MTAEQVQALLADYRLTKDIQLRDRIVLQYRHLVESIARRFMGSGEPLDDLVQEGYIGLITATDLYDSDKGVKFTTYATHFIIGQMKHSLRDRGKIIKEPAWLQELNHKMTKVIESLSQSLGRHPTDAEIGRVMHLPEENVAELLTTRQVFKVTSLDSEQDDSNGSGVDVENVRDDKYTSFHLPVEDKVVLETAMNKLKLIEQKVIEEFYFTGLSQTEIANKLGISCNYVSHILRNGTKKLRRILTTEEIRDMQIQLQLSNKRTSGDDLASVTDAVTGMYNEEYILERLEEQLNRALRDKSCLAFMVVSIEGVEEFGSRYGAMRRDDAFYNAAQLVKDTVRKCDIVGRMGEYELAVIMPYTGEKSRVVSDRVCRAVSEAKFDAGASKKVAAFRVYAGYAWFPDHASDATELVEKARESLERRKQPPMDKAA